MAENLRKLNKSLIYLAFITAIFFSLTGAARSQKIVDKTVAIVSDGVRTELITYSDLVWQLALNPNVPISPPSSDDLNRALQVIIKFRLIALEAERLPSAPPTDEEIKAEIERILAIFPSPAEFEKRLKLVGFNSVKDENFQDLMKKRVAIEKYIDFRFRSFVVITPEEEKTYYQNTYTTDFRRRNQGLLLPKFETVEEQINKILTEQKVESNIEKFLDNAESRAEIVLLSDV
jgi:hypothetical protein